MTRATVMGTTAWGTTLAVVLARNGVETWLWARTSDEADRLQKTRTNETRLPGVPFPPDLRLTASLDDALSGTKCVLLAPPSRAMRQNARWLAAALDREVPVVSASKGLEQGSRLRMSQVLADELPPRFHPWICALSGPNLSGEIARGLLATAVVACARAEAAERVQSILTSQRFRVYTNRDMVGVELGGTLKNIIAIGAGISDGLGYGDNGKAAFITRGLAEITRLGVALGAEPLTLSGLAGLGDLLATCSSPLSRNRSLGEQLAKGRSLEEALASLTGTVEGVTTTVVALEIARELGVEMPITEQVHRVLFEGLDPRRAVAELMMREPKQELVGT